MSTPVVENLFYTSRLLHVADPLWDASASVIKKIATAIFSAVAIPIGILFTLAADGLCYGFHNLCRKKEENSTPPPPVQKPNPPPEISHRRVQPNQQSDLQPERPSEAPPQEPPRGSRWGTAAKMGLAAAAVGLVSAGAYWLYHLFAPAVVSNAAATVSNVASSALADLSAASSSLLAPLALRRIKHISPQFTAMTLSNALSTNVCSQIMEANEPSHAHGISWPYQVGAASIGVGALGLIGAYAYNRWNSRSNPPPEPGALIPSLTPKQRRIIVQKLLTTVIPRWMRLSPEQLEREAVEYTLPTGSIRITPEILTQLLAKASAAPRIGSPSQLNFAGSLANHPSLPRLLEHALFIQQPNFSVPRPLSLPSPAQTALIPAADFSYRHGSALIQKVASKRDFASQVNQFLFDPGNPTKGLKYSNSLFAAREQLNTVHRGWWEQIQALKPAADARKNQWFFQRVASNFNYNPAEECAASAYAALKALREFDLHSEVREPYSEFVANARSALLLAEKVPNKSKELQIALKLLQEACHHKFVSVPMYPFFEDFIGKALRATEFSEPNYSLHTIAKDIQTANNCLRNVPPIYRQQGIAQNWKKLQGTIGYAFDPTADSNTPWIHSKQTVQMGSKTKEITILRHGTPTRDPGFFGLLYREGLNVARGVANSIPYIGSELARMFSTGEQLAEVIPEYEAHLRAHPEKITLYVNHQEYSDEKIRVHGELGRSLVLKALEKSHPNFHCAALPLDGPLWNKEFLAKVNAEGLKDFILLSIVNGTDGFALPAKLKDSAAFSHIGQILARVHAHYFKSGEFASPDKKKAFIMLFYSELKDYLKEQLDVDFMVSACKDNKDRGNASTTVDMIKNLMLLGKEHDPHCLRELFYSVLGPFIIKNEHIIGERLELALHVIEHIAGLSDKEKEFIRSETPMKIVKQEIPKGTGSLGQMQNPQAFLRTVKHMKAQGETTRESYPGFEKEIISDFRSPHGTWNLPLLKQQIEKDLPRSDIRLDDERMLNFQQLLEKLGLDTIDFSAPCHESKMDKAEIQALRFLSLLQQGTWALAHRAPSIQLNRNSSGLIVAQIDADPNSRFSSQIQASYRDGEYKLEASTNLELTNRYEYAANNSRHISYPILARAEVSSSQPATLSWQFT